MEDRWGQGPPADAGPIEQLIYLANRVGEDPDLVQAGGGNCSVKLRLPNLLGQDEDTLVVKGSGTDMRTMKSSGFSHLSMSRLGHLQSRGSISDEEMIAFMSACMLRPWADPLPSVETVLHAVLPQRVILHTHDVASLSLTNLDDESAAQQVQNLYPDVLQYVEYQRAGFPLARALMDLAPHLPDHLHGLALAHHGLVVWADDAATCYQRLLHLVQVALAHIDTKQPSTHVFGPALDSLPDESRRHALATSLMPVIRGSLSDTDKVILNLDDSPGTLQTISRRDFAALSQRGVATPEHILRTGRLPLTLELDLTAGEDEMLAQARRQLTAQKTAYQDYHRKFAGPEEEPIADWAKTVIVPGVGLVTAFKDKSTALVARDCYRAVMATQANADALGGFRFLSDEEVYHFEHWPLERRKVTEAIARERDANLLPRHICLILGGGSGIGEAAAQRFAQQGAHVVVGDLDEQAAKSVAEAICRDHPGRAQGVAVDVRHEQQIQAAVQRTVLAYGGLDSLFYTPGLAPRFAPLAQLSKEDLQIQIDINYVGALLAVKAAAAVMRSQGLGGAIVCSVSKAALAPGRQAAAYGGSKAGLLHALRVAALELGADGIRVNSINADQVETPLFLKFAEARAKSRGISLEEQLAGYRERNALGVSLIPAAAVADLAVLLAGDTFRYTTGDIITIDGGLPDAFPR